MCKLNLDKSKFDITTEVMAHLHWLLVRQRINFKIATITHKCIYGTEQQYLKDLLAFTLTPRNLRSSTDTRRVTVSFTKCKTFAAQSFSTSAPTVWNQLPTLLREIKNIELFKKQLKKPIIIVKVFTKELLCHYLILASHGLQHFICYKCQSLLSLISLMFFNHIIIFNSIVVKHC